MSNVIDYNNKYNQAISNANINIAKNLRLTSIKKYLRYIAQIQSKIN